MWHVTCDMWHVSYDMWHVTCDMYSMMWHVPECGSPALASSWRPWYSLLAASSWQFYSFYSCLWPGNIFLRLTVYCILYSIYGVYCVLRRIASFNPPTKDLFQIYITYIMYIRTVMCNMHTYQGRQWSPWQSTEKLSTKYIKRKIFRLWKFFGCTSIRNIISEKREVTIYFWKEMY